ncbi:hypothetical protein ACE10Z_04790 [Bradyrhizobium sp. Pha-3]|uniref:hypothetical protein n=1 Tax=Bradyrhizobium sp. Pha-3 TaxID=208375 RepID=UPI0035D4AC69
MGREADDFEFVQLERTFHELSRQERDSDEHGIAETFHVRGNLTWSDILKDYRTVILSEAGSGKTEEIRQAAKRLRAEGKAAFFLRLEHVASNFDDAFEAGSIEEFETWLKSGDEGWLFLDSIDEARLKSPLDFASAVRKLGTRVKVAVQRAHVIITGRTHAWRAKSDAQLCESQFPFRASTQTISKIVDEDPAEDSVDAEQKLSATRTERPVEPIFKIVALDDLDRDQIKRFAWRSRRQVSTYTRGANQKRLAHEAGTRIAAALKMNGIVPLSGTVESQRDKTA